MNYSIISNSNKHIFLFRTLVLSIFVVFCFTGLFGCSEENPSSIISTEDDSRNGSSERNNETSEASEKKDESSMPSLESSTVEETNSISETDSAEESIEENSVEQVVIFTDSMNSLQAIIEQISYLAPYSAGYSMKIATRVIAVLDWAMDAEISDDQIMTVWKNWPLDKEYYVYEEVATFTHKLAIISSSIYDIEEHSANIPVVLQGFDVFNNSKYPWNEDAIKLAKHVMDLSGIKDVKQLPEDLSEVSWIVTYQPD